MSARLSAAESRPSSYFVTNKTNLTLYASLPNCSQPLNATYREESLAAAQQAISSQNASSEFPYSSTESYGVNLATVRLRFPSPITYGNLTDVLDDDNVGAYLRKSNVTNSQEVDVFVFTGCIPETSGAGGVWCYEKGGLNFRRLYAEDETPPETSCSDSP